ncbi:Plasmodium exported protein, unknown function [Plasmodium vivax]|nr:Plasmodium exported protein, unknown function [Plasmodium vivax]
MNSFSFIRSFAIILFVGIFQYHNADNTSGKIIPQRKTLDSSKYSNYSRLLAGGEADAESNLAKSNLVKSSLGKTNVDKSNDKKVQNQTATVSDKKKKPRDYNIFKRADSYYEKKVFGRLNNIYDLVGDRNIDDRECWMTILHNISMIYAFPSLLLSSSFFFLLISDRGSQLRNDSFVIFLISSIIYIYTFIKILKYHVLLEKEDKHEFSDYVNVFKSMFA